MDLKNPVLAVKTHFKHILSENYCSFLDWYHTAIGMTSKKKTSWLEKQK